MFRIRGIDAFVVMLHDQGHIAAKLLAPDATAAVTIGSPILFSSVAHGSAHDIAGKGVANPKAMIEALLRLSEVEHRASGTCRSGCSLIPDSTETSRCRAELSYAIPPTWTWAAL